MTIEVWPLDGPAQMTDTYGDHWGDHLHASVDIFAGRGTPVLALAKGVVAHREDPRGGHTLTLRTPDGTRYYHAHLDSYEGPPRAVEAGDMVGFVGSSGNATGKSPHVHLEVHPPTGGTVDPFPLLAAVAPRGAARPRHRAPSTLAPRPPEGEPEPEPGGTTGPTVLGLVLLAWFASRARRRA